MGGVVDLDAAHAERGLAESAPTTVLHESFGAIDGSASEGRVCTKVISSIAQSDVSGTTRIGFVVVDRHRALVGDDMAIDNKVDAVGIEDGLQSLAHELSLKHCGTVGGVHRHIEHNDHPRSGLAIQLRR